MPAAPKPTEADVAHILPALRVHAVPIGSMRPLPGNPNKGDIEAVARSLQKFGQREVVTTCPPFEGDKDERPIVTAGNHRAFHAAKKLGWGWIAAVPTDDDEQTAIAWALASNQTAKLSTTDEAALGAMLDVIAEVPELLDASGFDIADIEHLDAKSEGRKAEHADGVKKAKGSETFQYALVFDSPEDQQRWFAAVRWMKKNVTLDTDGGGTVASRLLHLLSEHIDDPNV